MIFQDTLALKKNTRNDHYYFPNINTWIAILTQDCMNCQTSKTMSNVLMAQQQPFLEVSSYLNHRISMDTKRSNLTVF